MYTSFFGLKEKPFNMTPDPKFLFYSQKHKEAFAHLIYGIKERQGFIEITGEVGTGKTTLCRALFNEIGPDIKIGVILNPDLSGLELLQTIVQDFGLSVQDNTNKKELMDSLNQFLITQLARGHNVVLLIDEAQNLSLEALEQVRLLSNLETEKEKLIQIVLVGQPELREKLSLPELRQLNQRITVRYHLDDLDKEETTNYIQHRLKVAGFTKGILFTSKAMDTIFEYSHGTPRLINLVAHHALITAYSLQIKKIGTSTIDKATIEIEGKQKTSPQQKNTNISTEKTKDKTGCLYYKKIPAKSWKQMGAGLALCAFIYCIFIFSKPKESINTTNSVSQKVTSKLNQLQPPLSNANLLSSQKKITKDSITNSSNKINLQIDNNFVKDYTGKESLTKLLALWGVDIASVDQDNKLLQEIDKDALNFQSIAETYGLKAEIALNMDLERLMVFNKPCILKFYNHNLEDKAYYVLLTKIKNDSAVVYEQDDTKKYHLDELKNLWKNEAIILWKDLDNLNKEISHGMVGEQIKTIQNHLKRLGFYTGVCGGYYGQLTELAVKNFQTKYNLDNHGIVEEPTKIVLYSQLNPNSLPTLLEDNE